MALEYAIERSEAGVPLRMFWIPPENRPKCACGGAASHFNHLKQAECQVCYEKRTGMYAKGWNPDCKWCTRGCLMCTV